MEAFGQLAEQIVSISREGFVELPETLPREKMVLIPAEVPGFMDTGAAAREIRSCYIQHTISSILFARIFRPFLFTLGRRYGGVDTFLQSLSTSIRQKSERREAAWRQTSLRAAYTVSKAREAINVVAAVIVDEIMDEIKYFAHFSQWSVIVLAVQRIAKSAAEIWRWARVERELIKPVLPEIGTDETTECQWTEPELDVSGEVPVRTTCGARQVILYLLPHIVRESIHEGFLASGESAENRPCIYLQGKALFSDSSVVITRRRELGAWSKLTRSRPVGPDG